MKCQVTVGLTTGLSLVIGLWRVGESIYIIVVCTIYATPLTVKHPENIYFERDNSALPLGCWVAHCAALGLAPAPRASACISSSCSLIRTMPLARAPTRTLSDVCTVPRGERAVGVALLGRASSLCRRSESPQRCAQPVT